MLDDLNTDEVRRLRQLADDIVAGTEDRTFWIGGARDTSLAILRQVAEWLGDACGQRRFDRDRPGSLYAHLPCVRPAGHPGQHLDALGQSWEQPAEVPR